jgi:hypothetical protein
MKQQTICHWLKIVPALLLLCLSGVAQRRPDTAVKQELALRIGNGIVPWELQAFKGGGGSGDNFRRIESWKPSSKEATVSDIEFKIDRDGDIVIVHLSVSLENDKEVLVGTYRLREGETIRTEALTKFGLEPLVLEVVKAKPPFKDPLPPIPPQLENKTKAIEVVSFYQAEDRSESFQLTLRNTSDKDIMALDLFMTSADGNGGAGGGPRGDKSHPVILSGGTWVHYILVSRGGRMTPEGFVPDVALPRTLIIRTVVFSDGTYEGLVEPAAEMEAQRRGLDVQRRRILGLLEEPKETDVRDGITSLNDLKEQAYALSKTADASVAPELLALFPSLDQKSKGWLLESVEGGLRLGKLELLRYIKDFEEMQQQPGDHISFAEWIKQTKANYEKLTKTL